MPVYSSGGKSVGSTVTVTTSYSPTLVPLTGVAEAHGTFIWTTQAIAPTPQLRTRSSRFQEVGGEDQVIDADA